MDTHTLELLEFEKIRTLVAAQRRARSARTPRGSMEPSRDPGEIRSRQALTTEMTEALSAGLSPPFGGLHDIRPQVRRAQVGSMLDTEELSQTVETLRAVANLDHWLGRVGDEFPRLGALKQVIGEFSGVVNAIEGCIDARGKILDTASRKLSQVRREIGQAEERIQETLRRMLRSNEMKRILRFPNFTMVGHHYVLPIAKEHRGEIQGSVHRTSASNETVYVEPQAIAEQSAQLSYLRSREAKEIRRILPLAERPGGPGGRLTPRLHRDPGRAGPDLRARPLQPRLPDDAARFQPGGEARAARGQAPAARSPVPWRIRPASAPATCRRTGAVG